MNNLSFKYKTIINQPLNKIFDFYSNPKNINLLTPWFVKVSCTPEKKISKNEVFNIETNILGIKNTVEILIKIMRKMNYLQIYKLKVLLITGNTIIYSNMKTIKP